MNDRGNMRAGAQSARQKARILLQELRRDRNSRVSKVPLREVKLTETGSGLDSKEGLVGDDALLSIIELHNDLPLATSVPDHLGVLQATYYDREVAPECKNSVSEGPYNDYREETSFRIADIACANDDSLRAEQIALSEIMGILESHSGDRLEVQDDSLRIDTNTCVEEQRACSSSSEEFEILTRANLAERSVIATALSASECEPSEPFPVRCLADVPGMGPGLVWMLQERGITTPTQLAESDPDWLSSELGLVGQILDIPDLIRTCRQLLPDKALLSNDVMSGGFVDAQAILG